MCHINVIKRHFLTSITNALPLSPRAGTFSSVDCTSKLLGGKTFQREFIPAKQLFAVETWVFSVLVWLGGKFAYEATIEHQQIQQFWFVELWSKNFSNCDSGVDAEFWLGCFLAWVGVPRKGWLHSVRPKLISLLLLQEFENRKKAYPLGAVSGLGWLLTRTTVNLESISLSWAHTQLVPVRVGCGVLRRRIEPPSPQQFFCSRILTQSVMPPCGY